MAGVKLKYGKMHREDYFERLEYFQRALIEEQKRVDEMIDKWYHKYQADPYDQRELRIAREGAEWCQREVERYSWIVEYLLETKYADSRGKSLSEYLGYEVDEHRDTNDELEYAYQEDREEEKQELFFDDIDWVLYDSGVSFKDSSTEPIEHWEWEISWNDTAW